MNRFAASEICITLRALQRPLTETAPAGSYIFFGATSAPSHLGSTKDHLVADDAELFQPACHQFNVPFAGALLPALEDRRREVLLGAS